MKSNEHHDEYMGRRIKSGIFRSKRCNINTCLYSGSVKYNKKVIPEAFADWI